MVFGVVRRFGGRLLFIICLFSFLCSIGREFGIIFDSFFSCYFCFIGETRWESSIFCRNVFLSVFWYLYGICTQLFLLRVGHDGVHLFMWQHFGSYMEAIWPGCGSS